MGNNAPILITGAAKRIGLFCAKKLHQQYPVIITYRTETPAIDTLRSAGIICLHADFSSQSGIQNFITQLKETTTSLRAVIHNASSWLSEDTVEDPAALMQSMLQVHVHAPYQINLACADMLIAEQPAQCDIIHITDYMTEAGSPSHIAYAASKAALENMAMSFAKKMAPQVKVNAIAPSLILFDEHASTAYQEKTLKKSVFGLEPGEVEIEQAIQFILKSKYMTGRVLRLEGGRHLPGER
ncbi:dihydromonapterin reductase [Algicola sagamiensis]|uniref:dihydromonapterin reductase n=1 Tax=Algicola sagamiensis TaxID=163869 RepID=UPI00036B37A3|nr:dihydromonapterin reductase [Algicola sagamiensis]